MGRKSNYSEPSSSKQRHDHKRRREDNEDVKSKKHSTVDIIFYKYDLNNFLEDHCSIKKSDDFWTFYAKYSAAQELKKTKGITFDSSKLLNIDFAKPAKVLYEKLPLYTKQGEKMHIPYNKFLVLYSAMRTYQDFQQKMNFAKLKALRNAQKDLPIAHYKEDIIKKVQDNKVILIAGDTGCGKSTQVAQYMMEAGFKRIACTQPRRIACVALAKRVAYETLATYKNKIGFQIRFEKAKNKGTNVIFLTEGILLRQAGDDVMSTYDALILDEVHERHLNMDFLVGIMKCLLHKRDFKLILMSATINLQLFEAYFESEGVKTIKVPGRLYPIELHYKPIIKDPYDKKKSKFDCQPYLNILELIDQKYKPQEKGDVLIFLNGFNEINTLASAVESYAEIKKNWIVLQLHSTLSLEDQDKVFFAPPDGVRKCIISTNIAETSVTIDGVRFVIDSGKVNRMIYENCGINKLFESNISQDSAKQRSGRAGRTGPGICYRLYSEKDLKSYELFTPAEIHLVPLENLVLNMVTLGLSDIEAFPFLEKPKESTLRAAMERLSFLEALKTDDSGLSLTTLGNSMSQLPVDLTVAKMLIMSTIFGTVNAVLALASLLSVQNPLMESKFYETRDCRAPYESDHGEPITLLNLYKGWLQVKRTGEQSRNWTKSRGVEEQRFYEVTKLIEQFRDILQDSNLIPKLDNEVMSSSERVIRKGELKRLRDLRRELKTDSRDTKRKKLEMYNKEDDDTKDIKDLRDVEFRISNDFNKLQQLLSETRTDSFKDLMLLKLILTGALYPQVAIEDEFNCSKTVNERLYHTKIKSYVFLRPTSYFTLNPTFLELNDSDIDVPPNGYFSKKPLSRKHQLLVFQKVLETKKTYLMNAFRMPALQTLLLFGRVIGTNRTLTKFVFDDFILVNCPFLWQGKVMLLKSINLRKRCKAALEKKLNEKEIDDTELVNDMIEFMQANISYNIKRLLPADIKVIYTRERSMEMKENPFDKDFEPAENELGGFNVSPNVIYNCLESDGYDIEAENSLILTPCPKCGTASLNFLLYLAHDEICNKDDPKKVVASKTYEAPKPNSRNYNCDRCGKTMLVTPVEFLRHKKICANIKIEKV
ncbi:PREDICTED: probable ATP-dependent RNA helicase DHX34 [Nicrophorus vespilloides]|uniref:Probable ATP-dependent RNA helicase DHX34 n=1 Tax=Nicrophorus vespilloides TaxID=110193 RepID=A0ABM1NJZ7_NICVS|nr:PREDICTED: probable ATP-dependent RNA helicase DHX34 [Nicrophorus vespilloides]